MLTLVEIQRVVCLTDAFALFDADGDGSISAPVFRDKIHEMIPDSSPDVLYALMRTMDTDFDNRISLNEFVERFRPAFLRAKVYSGANPGMVQKAVTKLGNGILGDKAFCERLCGKVCSCTYLRLCLSLAYQ